MTLPAGLALAAESPPALDPRPLAALGLELQQGVRLAPLTTMKVGGPAQFFVTATNTDQLIRIVRWARDEGLAYFVMGGGSNILVSDSGIRGLVIYNRCRTVRVDAAPCCQYPQDDRPYLFAESGAPTAGAARTSVNAGLSGLEWAISIPGTIGGAVVGNAGAHGGEVKDTLEYGYLIDEGGEVREFRAAEMDYAYRDSALKRLRPLRAAFRAVVLSANFRLVEGDSGEIRARAETYLHHRRSTQPVEPSLGSTFVNPPGDFAGRLIEAAGLKGEREGGVVVSLKHANFFVNPGGAGGASAQQVVTLMRRVRQIVEDRFGVRLVPEVQLAGEWDEDAL